MPAIKRNIKFTKGLREELDNRFRKDADFVADISTVNTANDDAKNKVADAKSIKIELDKRISSTSIINDLTTGGADKVLSAEQGKTLKGLIDGMSGGLQYKGTLTVNGDYDLTAGINGITDFKTGDFFKVAGNGNIKVGTKKLEVNTGDMVIFNKIVASTNINVETDIDKIDNTEAPDILRTENISKNNDFAVDGTKIPDRDTIKTFVEEKVNKAVMKFINDTVTITGTTATLTQTPMDNFIFLGYGQVDNGDDTTDLVTVTANGKTLTVGSPDYNGKQIMVSYAYKPTA